MIKVAVAGATGRLGSMICQLVREQSDMELVAAIVSDTGGNVGKEIAPEIVAIGASQLPQVCKGIDVLVDVTSASAAERTLRTAVENGVNTVVGTTGLDSKFVHELEEMVAARGCSSLITPNFSIGVNVFWKTCQMLADALPEYEVEIIELHHDKKKDAPSGTAVKAAQLISEATGVDRMVYGRQGQVGARGREIGIHAIRAGDIIGEHTVIFAANRERIELTHKAHSRMAFAEGCIIAIRWIQSRKEGRIHSMEEVLGL